MKNGLQANDCVGPKKLLESCIAHCYGSKKIAQRVNNKLRVKHLKNELLIPLFRAPLIEIDKLVDNIFADLCWRFALPRLALLWIAREHSLNEI